MNMRLIVFIPALSIFLLLLGIGYKVHARNSLKNLVSTYESAFTDEYSIIEESNYLEESLFERISDYGSLSSKAKLEEQLEKIDDVIRESNLNRDKDQEYGKKISENEQVFKEIANRGKLLTGR